MSNLAIKDDVYIETDILPRKKVAISSKRQITIPQIFYKKLGFSDYAEVYIEDGKLIVCPEKSTDYTDLFAEQILTELVSKGLTGSELIESFKEEQLKVKDALYKMCAEADRVAEGKAEYGTMEDVFGKED